MMVGEPDASHLSRADLSVVRVSPLRRRHLPGVLRIEKQVYPRPWTMGLYLGELALPATRIYLVARIGSRVVGYGGVMMNLDEGHVTTLAVDPSLQSNKVGTRLLLLDEPFEGVAPVLSKRLGEVIAGLKGSATSVLIAQSDLNHSRRIVDSEVVIERGANLERVAA